MINPNFDPTWLLDMAKESEENFKQTLALMLEAHREIAASEEQERIVTLITKLKSAPSCFELDLDALIAGIKGELND